MRLGDPLRGVPVLRVDVHEDGLFGLGGLDEFGFGVGEAAFVLQEDGVFEVDVCHFRGHRRPRQLEGEIEMVGIHRVVDTLPYALARIINETCCRGLPSLFASLTQLT